MAVFKKPNTNMLLLLGAVLVLEISQINALSSADTYNGYCFACVHYGYSYCGSDSICRTSSGQCSGTEYSSQGSLCPVSGFCSSLGVQGLVFVGDPKVTGGLDTS